MARYSYGTFSTYSAYNTVHTDQTDQTPYIIIIIIIMTTQHSTTLVRPGASPNPNPNPCFSTHIKINGGMRFSMFMLLLNAHPPTTHTPTFTDLLLLPCSPFPPRPTPDPAIHIYCLNIL